jgi:adenylyltransferase/sulfurtransferase
MAMRYARHLALPEVGASGQARLGAARVLVVGAGGLGSPAALYLAAAGVGTLGIVDADRVELSNLQRQILHDTPGVGEEKVASAARRLRALNPDVRIEPHPVRLEPTNALELLRGYDLVVDGSDNLATRYLVNDACLTLGIPWVYGAVERWIGHVAIFAAPGGPCFRCLFRDPPPPGAVPGCAEAGVVGALPGIMGSMQALEAIKWIVQAPGLAPLVGRLLVFDGARMTARHVHPTRQAGCPACGPEAARPFLEGDAIWHEVCSDIAGGGDASVEGVAPLALRDRLMKDAPLILLDVRARWEWDAGNLSHVGAWFLGPWPGDTADEAGRGIPPLLEAVPSDAPVVVYCRAGGRSLVAAQALVRLGFTQVAHLEGGLLRWAREVEPDQVVA